MEAYIIAFVCLLFLVSVSLILCYYLRDLCYERKYQQRTGRSSYHFAVLPSSSLSRATCEDYPFTNNTLQRLQLSPITPSSSQVTSVKSITEQNLSCNVSSVPPVVGLVSDGAQATPSPVTVPPYPPKPPPIGFGYPTEVLGNQSQSPPHPTTTETECTAPSETK